MLFARFCGFQIGMADDRASGRALVSRDALMTRIAGEDIWCGMADNGREHERGRLVAESGKLLKTGHIVINDGAWRNSMDERSAAKAAITDCIRRSRRARCNHFRNAN